MQCRAARRDPDCFPKIIPRIEWSAGSAPGAPASATPAVTECPEQYVISLHAARPRYYMTVSCDPVAKLTRSNSLSALVKRRPDLSTGTGRFVSASAAARVRSPITSTSAKPKPSALRPSWPTVRSGAQSPGRFVISTHMSKL